MFNFNYNLLRLNKNIQNKNDLKRESYELYRLLQCNSNGKKIYDQIVPLIDKHEYCTGGETVRRGYYCPDIHGTFTIGGRNRGRLLKKVQKNSKVSYEYCFANNCLAIVKNYRNFSEASLYEIEFIKMIDDIEIGVSFDILDDEISDAVSIYVCQYDKGRLICDRLLELNGTNIDDSENDYTYEKNWYEYDETILSKAIHLEYCSSIDLYEKIDVRFICDDDGCPIKFIVNEECDFINNITKVNQEYYKKYHMNK